MSRNKWYLFVIAHTSIICNNVLGASIQKRTQDFVVNDDTIIESASEDKILLQDKDFWAKLGQEELIRILGQMHEKKHVAKNVIIFIGDGMGMTTTTATRIYKGQRNFGKMGEEHSLSFDKFPNVALVKTYNVDMQVPDSAGTATALFTGVKTRMKSIGLDVKSEAHNFDPTNFEISKLTSLMDWAQEVGKYTGFVTTTRITHATPAALYANINNRDWELDTDIPEEFRDKVKDIARQLIEDEPGRHFRVILGGGQHQLGYTQHKRGDNINLTQIWIDRHRNDAAMFVVNTKDLEQVSQDTDFLLGLFDASHMAFDLVRNKGPEGTPSLSAMTSKALQILKRGPNGFVLMVEGGLIDHAHHQNYAKLAISEAAEFDEAVYVALNETGPETLILVTSDHSHSFTMNGYAQRGNDILGFGNETLNETIPYLTLAYGNGPGFEYHYQPTDENISKHPWRDITADVNRFHDPWYPHLATFFREDDTHAGEDVAIYGVGPGSHLVKGVIEQNTVAYIISYAACIGPQAHLNHHCPKHHSSSSKPSWTHTVTVILILYIYLYEEICRQLHKSS